MGASNSVARGRLFRNRLRYLTEKPGRQKGMPSHLEEVIGGLHGGKPQNAPPDRQQFYCDRVLAEFRRCGALFGRQPAATERKAVDLAVHQ